MKTIKNLFLVLAITLSNSVIANGDPTKDKISKKEYSLKISKEISSLLVNPNFSNNAVLHANVTFIINKNNEIVVLKVDTDNKKLDYFVKYRLNYQVISTKLDDNLTYKLPVKIIIK